MSTCSGKRWSAAIMKRAPRNSPAAAGMYEWFFMSSPPASLLAAAKSIAG